MNKILYPLLLISATSYAMEKTSPAQSDNQLQLIQNIYTGLGIEKSTGECQKILAVAKGRDRRAAQIYRYHGRPLRAPWRDSYMTSVRAVQSTTTPASAPKNPCFICDQFSKPDEYEKNNIYDIDETSGEMLNLKPYGPLHSLINPQVCSTRWENIPEEARFQMLVKAQRWLSKIRELGIDDAQIFLNLLDVCAGKSADHAHEHFLPRIVGDTSAIASMIGEDIVKSERQKLKKVELESGKTTLWYGIKKWNPEALKRVYSPYIQLLSSMDVPRNLRYACDCYACEVAYDKDNDQENLVIKRFDDGWIFRLVNIFINGHSTLHHAQHGKTFAHLDKQELQRFNELITVCQLKVQEVLKPRGLNIGILEGEEAGNEFPHARCDIVQREAGAVSATTVFTDNYIGDRNLEMLRERMVKSFESND